MLVTDYFARLSYGPLSNLSLSGEGSGTINTTQHNKLIEHLNTGLQKLYSRFVLREKNAIVEQYAHITFYHLDKRYAKENPVRPTDNTPYLIDLPAEPFEDDVLRILNVYDEYGVDRLNLSPDYRMKIYSPFPNTIQVVDPLQGRPLSVVYQANHRKLEFGVINAEITLPSVLESALISYVAYLVYGDMNTEGSLLSAQRHLGDYEKMCATIELNGSTGVDISPDIQVFHKRGWI